MHFYGYSGAVFITLHASVDDYPETPLVTETIPANTLTSMPTLYTIMFDSHPLLEAGTSYFISAFTYGSSPDGWVYNQTNSYPLTLVGYPNAPNNGYMYLPVAFQVNGTTVTFVPEPGALALVLSIGMTGAGFLARHWRSRRSLA